MKNFINSTKQRKYLYGSLLAAVIFSFLPAIRVPIIGSSVSLTTGSDGILTLIALILSLLIAFFQEEIIALFRKKIGKDFSPNIPIYIISVMLGLVLVRIIYIWQSIVFAHIDKTNPFVQAFSVSVGTGIGLYLTAISIIFALGIIFAFSHIDVIFSKISKKISEKSHKVTETIDAENSEKTSSKTISHETQEEKTSSKTISRETQEEKISENEKTENSSK